MAAVIGKCMLDSGAADRIVRAFLRLFGEKRSAMALMGSGFVLAVPVFFDTVFYLLVPLARSLYRRTQKNYLLYVLAIGGRRRHHAHARAADARSLGDGQPTWAWMSAC
jgi:gluconate:H+ symporter, GntP family